MRATESPRRCRCPLTPLVPNFRFRTPSSLRRFAPSFATIPARGRVVPTAAPRQSLSPRFAQGRKREKRRAALHVRGPSNTPLKRSLFLLRRNRGGRGVGRRFRDLVFLGLFGFLGLAHLTLCHCRSPSRCAGPGGPANHEGKR